MNLHVLTVSFNLLFICLYVVCCRSCVTGRHFGSQADPDELFEELVHTGCDRSIPYRIHPLLRGTIWTLTSTTVKNIVNLVHLWSGSSVFSCHRTCSTIMRITPPRPTEWWESSCLFGSSAWYVWCGCPDSYASSTKWRKWVWKCRHQIRNAIRLLFLSAVSSYTFI